MLFLARELLHIRSVNHQVSVFVISKLNGAWRFGKLQWYLEIGRKAGDYLQICTFLHLYVDAFRPSYSRQLVDASLDPDLRPIDSTLEDLRPQSQVFHL